MPEIVETRFVADYINKHIKDAQIQSITFPTGLYSKRKPDHYADFVKEIESKKVTLKKAHTKGKLIYMEFSNGMYLQNSLGLEGLWTNDTKLKYNHVHLKTSKGTFFYNDFRNFGKMKFHKDMKSMQLILDTIGPDVLDKKTTFEVFYNSINLKRLQKKDICNVINCQKYVSGVGNYIRADALYLAKISPYRKLEKITKDEFKKLHTAILFICKDKYKKTKLIEKKFGGDRHIVYGRKTDSLGNVVTRDTQEKGHNKGRSIYYVKAVQK